MAQILTEIIPLTVANGSSTTAISWQSRKVGLQDFVQVNQSAIGPVTIKYTAGYGDTPDTVPADIKRGILVHISHMYRFRDADADSVPVGLDHVYGKYSTGGIG